MARIRTGEEPRAIRGRIAVLTGKVKHRRPEVKPALPKLAHALAEVDRRESETGLVPWEVKVPFPPCYRLRGREQPISADGTRVTSAGRSSRHGGGIERSFLVILGGPEHELLLPITEARMCAFQSRRILAGHFGGLKMAAPRSAGPRCCRRTNPVTRGEHSNGQRTRSPRLFQEPGK